MLFHRRFGSRKASQKPAAAPARRFVPFVELLEKRLALSEIYTVINAGDDGNGVGTKGDLRYCLTQAMMPANAGSTIVFDIPASTISLKNYLPIIDKPVTIDGYRQATGTDMNGSQPNKSPTEDDAIIGVAITPSGSVYDGLQIRATNVTIKGLSIYGFRDDQITINSNSSNVTVVGCFIGTGPGGVKGPHAGNGIAVQFSTNVIIGGPNVGDRNLISGNGDPGGETGGIIVSQNTNVVTITNNLIGTDRSGTASNYNNNGVNIVGGGTVTNVTISNNVISGNSGNGIQINNTNNVQILNNFIGTAPRGTKGKNPNTQDGINLSQVTTATISGNYISANKRDGVNVSNFTTSLQLSGNVIGLDTTQAAAGNLRNGITMSNSFGNIGGSANAGAGNTIARNGGTGISITLSDNVISPASDEIQGNVIYGNGVNGMVMTSAKATIGGTTSDRGNVISGNTGAGILVKNPGTGPVTNATPVTIQGNAIGVRADGTTKWANTESGVQVTGATAIIGGTAAGAGNVISGNGGDGVLVESLGTALIQGNYIGVDADGTTSVGNGQRGVFLDGDNASTVGGTAAGAGNIISGNGLHGVDIFESTKGSLVQGNIIGLNASGTAARANSGNGVLVNHSSNVTVGGTVAGAGNIISGNGADGVAIWRSSNTLVAGNWIGTEVSGKIPVPNKDHGIEVIDDSSGTTIGGTTAAARNVISGNSRAGVYVSEAAALIQGNYIGVGADGSTPVGNDKQGVFLEKDKGSTVGGTAVGAGNVISGNRTHGVDIFLSNLGDLVQGNIIGLDAAGSKAVPNGDGVLVHASNNVMVGGTVAGAGNVISGNNGDGVLILPENYPGVTGPLVAGNRIGTDSTGVLPIANQGTGITAKGAVNLTIGGTTAAARNVIAGNTDDNVRLLGGDHVLVQGNYIGVDANGGTFMASGANGIATGLGADSNRVTNLTIGGTTAAAANVISGHEHGAGIWLNQVGTGVAVLGNYIGTDSTGQTAWGNKTGILINNKNDNVRVTIGQSAGAAGNVISGNAGNGVEVQGGMATLAGNLIGLTKTKTQLGNEGHGVLLATDENVIGQGNYIGGNFKSGVRITGNKNTVSQSTIGNNGQVAVPNAIGIEILGSSNTIGGTVASPGNVIAGNTGDGVLISLGNNNTLNGNLIGVLQDGTTALANGGAGVHAAGGSNTKIGLSTSKDSDRNIISGNMIAGVLVEKTTGTAIVHNYIGTDKAGQNALGNGPTAGVIVSTGAVSTTIGGTASGAGNLISGNFASVANGVQVQGNARETLIQGNTIGLGAGGTAALANIHGIVVQDRAADTTIGGSVSGAGNLISGNIKYGIVVSGRAASTTILGNTIGLDRNGDAQGNNFGGVLIAGGGNGYTTIGGGDGPTNAISPSRNVISGNDGNGITVTSVGALRILHNLIGTNDRGTAARPNTGNGIQVNDTFAEIVGNIVSGNAGFGILLSSTPSISIVGNFVGLTVNGNAPLGNGSHGILLVDAVNTTIGGINQTNMISANQGDGIRVDGYSDGTTIQGNGIGQAFGSPGPLANTGNGIHVTGNASRTTIGGTDLGEGNIISGNSLNGVQIDVDTTTTVLQGNTIGVTTNLKNPLSNGQDGVAVFGTGVTIGGTAKGAGNTISGNKGNGIQVSGVSASGTVIQGNTIGANGAGTDKIANGMDGILVQDGANNVAIGGTVQGSGNLISGNDGIGIHVLSTDTPIQGTMIQRNKIGTDRSGNNPLHNAGFGIYLDGTFTTFCSIRSVAIGGSTSSAGNILSDTVVVSNAMDTLIASNQLRGIFGDSIHVINESGVNGSGIAPTKITNNQLLGTPGTSLNGVEFDANAKGLILTGNTISGNDANGVLINGQNVTIGGAADGQRNTISSNTGNGIGVGATAVNVSILGNFIGTNSKNTPTIGNGGDGIVLTGGLQQVTIGGTVTGAGNVISGNKGNGIHLQTVANPVQIVGNRIGVNTLGNNAIANANDGILLEKSSNALIQSNVISGNSGNGIELKDGSNNNTVTANKIGVRTNGTTGVGNASFGVWVHQGGGTASSNNTIGGTTAGTGNAIGFNKEGVVIGDSLTDSSQHNAILGNSIFKSSVLIDLGNTGSGSYTPVNDAGPNLLEVPPTLISATVSGSNLKITGQLNGTGKNNTTFRIEFFAAGPALGAFKKFLGFIMVTTDGSGNVLSYSATFTGVTVPRGTEVSATATDPDGNTTGFAPIITASIR